MGPFHANQHLRDQASFVAIKINHRFKFFLGVFVRGCSDHWGCHNESKERYEQRRINPAYLGISNCEPLRHVLDIAQKSATPVVPDAYLLYCPPSLSLSIDCTDCGNFLMSLRFPYVKGSLCTKFLRPLNKLDRASADAPHGLLSAGTMAFTFKTILMTLIVHFGTKIGYYLYKMSEKVAQL